MHDNAVMSPRPFLVRTINRQDGTSSWVRVMALNLDDARSQVERTGLQPHEVRFADDAGDLSADDPLPPPDAPANPSAFADHAQATPPPIPPPGTPGSFAASDDPADSPFTPQPHTARTALLVSAIVHLVFGGMLTLAGVFTCFPLILGVPMIVMGVYELSLRNALFAPGPYDHLVKPLRTVAIIEVITIILGNVPSMVCGIMLLINLHELTDPRHHAAYRQAPRGLG
jgi:hypothetical protein